MNVRHFPCAAESQPQPPTGVRSANGLAVDLSTLQQLANASGSSRSNRLAAAQQSGISQQVQELLAPSKRKAASLAYTFKDGDPGDKGVRRRFLVLNERFLIADKRKFSFTREWTTVKDRSIDEAAKALFDLFGTEEIEEWDFDVGQMLEGAYGVAPWSVSLIACCLLAFMVVLTCQSLVMSEV